MRKGICAIAVTALLLSAAFAEERMTVRRDAVVKAIERAAPAVVNISTDKVINRDFFRGWDLFGGPRVAHSLGSGAIFTSDGYVFTNAHVVNQASRIVVRLLDGSSYEADLVNVDVASDLAVLKIDAERPLPTVVFGRSDDLMVGEKAIAVGNPFGLENSVTTGVISAAKRDIEEEGRVLFKNVLQTDALINPGNSGGPLLNIFGEVIGVNSAIRAGAQGIGFAIPIDRAKKSLAALLDYRKLRRISLGLELEGRYPGGGPAESIVVAEVHSDGPAARAGVRPGDVVTALDGEGLSALAGFMARMLSVEKDREVALGIERGGRGISLSLSPVVIPMPDAAELARRMLGLSIQQMNRGLASHVGINLDHGILVSGVERGSTAWNAGLRAGDVIRQVNHTYVRTMEDMGLALEEAQGAQGAVLDFIRAEGFLIARYVIEVPFQES